MNCTEIGPLVEAYHDGEVDLVRHLEIENHLNSCASCTQRLEAVRQVHTALQSSNLRYNAPESLRRWAVAKGDEKVIPSNLKQWPKMRFWQPVAVAALLFLMVGTPILFNRAFSHRQADEIVSAHVRSLMASHLTDVASSNQHTVKPWFSGKIDFSPLVHDLSAFNFPLIGGRLDYVANRSVAALVYQHQQHFINLFIWPSPGQRDSGPETLTKRGYNLIHWARGGMTYWTISDLNNRELTQFSQIIQ